MNLDRTMRRLVPAVCLFAGLFAANALAGQQVTKDGVLHVVNGSEPAGGTKTIDLQESWRVGGEDGEDFFGMISQVVIGQDGNIYLLDTRLAEVPVYSPDGERLATLSREGEGPGEVRMPSNLMFLPNGNLGIAQVFPGQLTMITTDGTPAGVFRPGGSDATAGGFRTLFDFVVLGEDLVITSESISQTPTGQDRTNYVASFDLEGNEKVRFWEDSYSNDFTNFVFDEGRFRLDFRRMAVSGDGRLYVADSRDEYRITVYKADGTVDRVIERAFEPRKRTGEEKDEIRTRLEGAIRAPFEVKIEIADTVPTIAWVCFGPDGNLWITHSRSGIDQPEGVMVTLDVFSPDGEYLRKVAARCEGDGEQDILIWTPDGSAVQVTGYTEALQQLQGGGAGGGSEDDGEAEPMEIVYMRVSGL